MSERLAEATLAAICTLVTDGTHDSPPLLDSGIPFIKGKHINKGYVDFDNCDFISYQDHLKVISRSKPEKGDILFANIGNSIGDAAFVSTEKEFSIKNVALFKPDSKRVNCRYLYYHIVNRTFQDEILVKKSGSAQPFVGLDTLRHHTIRYHSDLEEQGRIVEVLSAYDDLIENNTRRIMILEEMAQMIYREWFVNFRFPGHEKTKLVESGHGLIPEGWQLRTLGDLTSLVTKGTTPTTLGREFQNHGINFVKVESISESGAISIDKMARIDAETHELLKRSQLRKADILFSIAGAIGRVALVTDRILPANTNQALAIIRCSDPASVAFVLLTVRSEGFLNFSLGRVVQTAQANVSLSILKSAPVIVPPQPVLRSFDEIVCPLVKLIVCYLSKNDNLRRTRDLLLPKLISGEVNVKDSEAESVGQGL